MAECRLCGLELREGEDVVEVGGHLVHPDCAGTHAEAEKHHLGTWASMGQMQQMALGDVQRSDD
jgi:hypothetical protein